MGVDEKIALFYWRSLFSGGKKGLCQCLIFGILFKLPAN